MTEIPPKPQTHNGDIGNLPPALAHLRSERAWVCWCWFWDGKKWTKPPYRADDPERYASTSEPATWGSHEQAVEQVRAGKADGIGLALKGRNIGGVDLDHCCDPVSHQIEPWANDYVQRFPGAYVEITVSGRGLRVLGTSKLEGFAPKFKLNHGNGAAVELFSNSHHYLTLSCNEIGNCAKLPPIGDIMTHIAEELGASPKQSGLDFDAAAHVNDAPHVAPDDRAAPEQEPATSWSFAEETRLRSALAAIPTDEKVLAEKFGHSHDTWVKIGRAIERLDWGERGLNIFRDWSAQNAGEFNEKGLRTQWASFNRNRNAREKPTTIATVFLYAIKCGWGRIAEAEHDEAEQPKQDENGATHSDPKIAATQQDGVQLEDFVAYMPQRSAYFFKPSRELWPSTSVDARLPPILGPNGKPIKASAWLAANAAVEQTTWAPGEPMLIEDRLVSDAGWINRPGCSIFNLYRPPALVPQTGDVAAWLDLVRRVFPDQADHIILWLAHRVQRPHEKINHALVLGGKPGIGKDTILEPIKQAIGPWNFADVSPHRVLGSFNSFARSVILRISEARDLGDWDRFTFFDRMKGLIAAPPDVVQVNEKHLREYYIFNLCGVVITSNHKTDGIYLPADDRRHFVAWSSLSNEDFANDYWRKQYRWYASGGNAAVAAHLASLDLSNFDPKAPPPKTGAFWEIVNANRAPEDAELADVLDDLKRPDIVTLDRVASQASALQPAFSEWLYDKTNARRIPHRFEDCGYVVVRNPNDAGGRWKIKDRRHTIYGRATLTESERLAAALKFTGAR